MIEIKKRVCTKEKEGVTIIKEREGRGVQVYQKTKGISDS